MGFAIDFNDEPLVDDEIDLADESKRGLHLNREACAEEKQTREGLVAGFGSRIGLIQNATVGRRNEPSQQVQVVILDGARVKGAVD